MKVMMLGTALLMLGLSSGCDSEEASGGVDPVEQSVGTEEHIHWQPSGTFAVPVYGISCRFTADSVFSQASNDAADDTVALELASDGSAVVHLRVQGANGSILVAEKVSMTRGKKNESFRQAEGDPQSPIIWGDGLTSEGAVVDGMLCFSDRLQAGEELSAEFSLILQTSDGVNHAVGGSFLVSAGVVTDSGIPESPVDVDLQ